MTFPSKPPFAVVTRDTGTLVTASEVRALLGQRRRGVSWCVRSSTGDPNRGGYFFHLKPVKGVADQIVLHDFEGEALIELSCKKTADFVNHCTGRKFDEGSFQLSQNDINLRGDK